VEIFEIWRKTPKKVQISGILRHFLAIFDDFTIKVNEIPQVARQKVTDFTIK
jgi:hypothetical protein